MSSSKTPSSPFRRILVGLAVGIACLIALVAYITFSKWPGTPGSPPQNAIQQPSSVTSDDLRFEEAGADFRSGQREKALATFRSLAEAGHTKSQATYGGLLLTGTGVRQNTPEAFRWLRSAADKGDAGAQVLIGNAYHEGRGVRQDYVEAARWYRKAADQGYATALTGLGIIYLEGQGVEKDLQEGLRLLRLSADQGSTAGMYELGVAYENGKGVLVDLDTAAEWYRRADEAGFSAARAKLDALEAKRNAPTTATQTLDPVEQCFQESIQESMASGKFVHPEVVRQLCKQMLALSGIKSQPPIGGAESSGHESETPIGVAESCGKDADVQMLHTPPPRYPPQSRRMREEGTVVLRILVNESGYPSDVQVEEASGFPRLDQAGIAAVKRWRFSPACQNGKAVSGWVLVPLNFSLTG